MTSLQQLDKATSDVAQALFSAFADQTWSSLRYAARWTPAGDIGADDFWLVNSGKELQTLPELAASLRVSDAARRHWQLTQDLGQPRWYRMTVTVERDGRFSADFDYQDRYTTGDIMRSA